MGDTATVLATTAVRISECAGTVGDVVYDDGLIWVKRQTYPGRGGLITTYTPITRLWPPFETRFRPGGPKWAYGPADRERGQPRRQAQKRP
ncbi:hypothetical protein NBCG_02731 [Nocardioidaceae bacterium Broad-1]|nr:hypothetical protein NBCG_02731 [Nocardioidaceae bacterium Broad-1]